MNFFSVLIDCILSFGRISFLALIGAFDAALSIVDDTGLLGSRRKTATISEWIRRLMKRRPDVVRRMTPPRKLIYVGRGDFLAVGEEFAGYLVGLCNLRPEESVLDVGCGVGRIAIPLTQYLAGEGSYDGFDIVGPGIEWCRQRITTKYPRFIFKLLDVTNTLYNPAGRVDPLEVRFPYEDETFDLVFVVSVFTHMLPQGVEHYLSEIFRVLKSEGRCLMTAFLIDDVAEQHLAEGVSPLYPRFNCGLYRVISKDSQEITVFHEQANLLRLIEASGLRLARNIDYGSWCGRRNYLSYQDVVVAEKR